MRSASTPWPPATTRGSSTRADGSRRVARGADRAKDQSYVVHMLDQPTLARTLFPVGHLTKDEVRAHAARLGLATADKPDSQDVCFITATGGRTAFLEPRLETHPGTVVDRDRRAGRPRRRRRAGHHRPAPRPRSPRRHRAALRDRRRRPARHRHRRPPRRPAHRPRRARAPRLDRPTPSTGPLVAQTSAHGTPRPCRVDGDTVRFDIPQRRVAPGQTVVLYAGDEVVAGGIVR